jgi:hypothetical protein
MIKIQKQFKQNYLLYLRLLILTYQMFYLRDVDLDDLSGNYKFAMRQILEIPEAQIDVLNPTIQLALKNNGNKGAMNLTEFERVLKQDPRWGNTSNARETAAGYANSILRNFGLIA